MSHKTAKRARRNDKDAVRLFAKRLISALRRRLGPRLLEERERFPNQALPCATCAFRGHTDTWPGFEKTVFQFANSLVAGAPFYCHVDPETGEPFECNASGEHGVVDAQTAGRTVALCAGWVALQGIDQDDAMQIVVEAMMGKPMERELTEELRRHVRVEFPKAFGR